MTTYEQGRAPEGAPVTWRYVTHEGCEIVLESGEILRGLHASDADAICGAFHFAKMAKDYVRACEESESTREADPFMETDRSRALAAKCDAARDALIEAVR